MDANLEEVIKAQQQYEKNQKRRRLQGRLNLAIAIMLIVMAIGGGTYYMTSEDRLGAKDCSNPRNANTPYCVEREGKSTRDWRSVTQGGGQGFNLTNR